GLEPGKRGLEGDLGRTPWEAQGGSRTSDGDPRGGHLLAFDEVDLQGLGTRGIADALDLREHATMNAEPKRALNPVRGRDSNPGVVSGGFGIASCRGDFTDQGNGVALGTAPLVDSTRDPSGRVDLDGMRG